MRKAITAAVLLALSAFVLAACDNQNTSNKTEAAKATSISGDTKSNRVTSETSLACIFRSKGEWTKFTLGKSISLKVMTANNRVTRIATPFGTASNENGYHLSTNDDGTVWGYIAPKPGLEIREENGQVFGIPIGRGNYLYHLNLNRITGELIIEGSGNPPSHYETYACKLVRPLF